ncbi:MAG: DNRLRE domain-containing protein [Verrucomicrobia bacterium]|nr:DNRLRE domain-containing protein [Verrucomicrobiota bacterium]MCH8526862.1 DNRLRE domain-containing protein [Kiritimatiellia bacterium]
MNRKNRLFSLVARTAPFLAGTLWGAVITVEDEASGATPELLAYNLGNFYPGSNTADWWRYARVSGARMFMAPTHFENQNTARPGDAEVSDMESFQTRRSALREDPYDTDYINWPAVTDRFSVMLSGNNRIVPQVAFEEIHRHGGTVLVQMTLSESGFPIADENDWQGKWKAWRTYYSLVFYLAREFGVERFSSHNEPNHPNTFIETAPWLMRLRLASDAARSAIEDVNRLHDRSLTLRFTAPVTAGSTGSAYTNYGRPAVQSIFTNYLGETDSVNPVFQNYAYQQYDATAAGFATDFTNLRAQVANDLPGGAAMLPFAISEFNVHTGANYDGMTATPDDLDKTARLAAILSRLTRSGMDELYLFKFAMTPYPSSRNFPVQKNGMLYADNSHAPYNYGTMTRGAEAYRLFNKAFAPGRELLNVDVSGTSASNLEVAASRDPETGFYYIYTVNETGSGIPVKLDLSQLGIPEGNRFFVEDVSQWRRGIIRSLHTVGGGEIDFGTQPGRSVWLITIPSRPQQAPGGGAAPLVLPVSKDVMVVDGIHANTNYGSNQRAVVRNDPDNVNERSVSFLQFDLPEHLNPEALDIAVLSIPIAALEGGGGEDIHVHLYGIDHHDWEEETLTWSNAPNLKQGAPAGDEIRHSVVVGAGDTAHILAQLTVSGSGAETVRHVDVTDFLRGKTGSRVSFMVVQEPRWDMDIHVNSIPKAWGDLKRGDTQADGIRIRTKEGTANGAPATTLTLAEGGPPPVDFDAWIEKAFPGVTDAEIIGPDADPNNSGLPNLIEFGLGRDPSTASSELFPGLFLGEGGEIGYTFTVNKLANGITMGVQVSFDLIDWHSEPLYIETTAENAQVFERLATVQNPGQINRAFFRLYAFRND